MLPQIRFTLVETSHPGNIGGVARAMKCMGLSELTLVAPKHFPHAEATSRASGAGDILQNARLCADLGEATGECVFVVGTTSRAREIPWPVVDPRRGAATLLQEAQNGPVAVLFGRESGGLTNKEVDLCHLLVRIPTNTQYESLNLASAAQVVAYEIYLAASCGAGITEHSRDPADGATMAMFYEHLEQALRDIDFIKPASSVKLMRKLTLLYNRAQPTVEEINILRGILTAAQTRKPSG